MARPDYAQSSSGPPFVLKNALLGRHETAELAGKRYRAPDWPPDLRRKAADFSNMSFVRNQVARCTVARLMRELDLRGVVRGRRAETPLPVATFPCPANRVNRMFQAPSPNARWIVDLTFVATWVTFAPPYAVVLS